jgi:hypothetical protein
LVETLEPPTIATNGRAGFFKALPKASNSAANKGPAQEIAANLEISMKTVEAHREHIRAKLNMHANSELVQHAIHWVHSESIPH